MKTAPVNAPINLKGSTFSVLLRDTFSSASSYTLSATKACLVEETETFFKLRFLTRVMRAPSSAFVTVMFSRLMFSSHFSGTPVFSSPKVKTEPFFP